jgi:hypothetical protein
MFFNIGHVPLENYPCHWQLGSFSVSTDQGWKLTTQNSKQILYKGYADDSSLDLLLEEIASQSVPNLTGNFCALICNNGNIEIRTDRYRNFPIYVGNGVNNLKPTNRTIWTDSQILVHPDLSVTEHKFDVIGKIDVSEMSYDEVLNNIIEILDQKTTAFLKHNQLPIRAFLTGGVDSMLVYSFLHKHTTNYELIKYSHIDYDYFWLKNSGDIKKNWGYMQIHHWLDSCVLTSGTPGDEYMLRSPATADLFLKYHGIKIAELLLQQKWANCLHHTYFSKNTHSVIFEQQKPIEQSMDKLHWSLCNIIVNDWQHWHIGNTLTWTPLRNLEIFKLMLRLPVDVAVAQAMNSELSIRIIEHNYPGLSKAISYSKNSGNMLSNLTNIYE